QVFSMKRYQELIAPYARLLPHENISRVSEVVTGERSVYVFFARSYGDMHSYVRACKRLPEEEAARLFGQMAAAVAHCHEHGVVLRDLKLRKFVFADLQRSRARGESVTWGDQSVEAQSTACPGVQSSSPALLLTSGETSQLFADEWSLGVVLYTMLVGRYPFQDVEPAALFNKIRRGVFSVPESLSPRAKCLVRCVLRKSPAERLEASEILLHPWLRCGGTASAPAPLGPTDRHGADQVVPDFDRSEDADYL
uniref:Tribbles pseudokinase 3 n=1 Tax=Lepisosteus oculatus TaxID=7918 RepID=W5MHZ6_LEPOC